MERVLGPEMGDFVREVWVHSPAKPRAHAVNVHYYYRHTTLARDAVVSSVVLQFERGDPETVRAEMQQRRARHLVDALGQQLDADAVLRHHARGVELAGGAVGEAATEAETDDADRPGHVGP